MVCVPLTLPCPARTHAGSWPAWLVPACCLLPAVHAALGPAQSQQQQLHSSLTVAAVVRKVGHARVWVEVKAHGVANACVSQVPSIALRGGRAGALCAQSGWPHQDAC